MDYSKTFPVSYDMQKVLLPYKYVYCFHTSQALENPVLQILLQYNNFDFPPSIAQLLFLCSSFPPDRSQKQTAILQSDKSPMLLP